MFGYFILGLIAICIMLAAAIAVLVGLRITHDVRFGWRKSGS